MKRVFLPVVTEKPAAKRTGTAIDRRVVLRGLAATLLASLASCGTDPRQPEDFAGEPGGGTGGGSTGGGSTGGGSTGGGSTGGGSSGGAATADPGFAMCGDELCLDLSADANAALRDIDGARVITVDDRRFLIVRTDETTFVALSAICTHAGCTVRYAAGSRDVVCPCHGSTFELDGSVTNGPAQSPLDLFVASYDATAGIVTVTI
jgi:cytochrome b6-f complex iron-sulfur subunit